MGAGRDLPKGRQDVKKGEASRKEVRKMGKTTVVEKREMTYWPRKANDCISDPASYRPPERLFDEFWREGELSLLFGASGTGKTVLAVQIAEALARGRAIEGMEMPEKRRRVLYVDLVHTGEQFHARRLGENGRIYKFSENLQRNSPDDPEKLIEWLREAVSREGFKVVIIDDLAALRSTFDGTRETLKLMRDLRSLKNELGISILVISPSREPRSGERVGESCLMRSRVLCEVADSVFAIGRHERQPEWLYLMQIRSRGAAISWKRDNAPYARIKRQEDGLLAMHFDERFEPKLDAETRRLVIEIKAMQDRHSIREIAAITGQTRSRVERLLKKRRPSMQEETEQMIEDLYPSETEEDDVEEELRWEHPDYDESSDDIDTADADEAAFFDDGESGEPETDPPQRSVLTMTQDEIFEACGCWRGEDVNGNFVWIETADSNGKPIIMYQPARVGYDRWKYTSVGKMGFDRIHGPVCIRDDFR